MPNSSENASAPARRPSLSEIGKAFLRLGLVAKHAPETVDPRLLDLLARKPVRVAAIALANKTARIWAIMTRGDTYRAGHVPALAA